MKELFNVKFGETLHYSGLVATMRDRASLELLKTNRSPIDLSSIPIYHSGPVVKKVGIEFVVEAFGPTTSMRMDSYTEALMAKFGAKVFIGKGGLGDASMDAFKKHQGRYFHTIGGAAALLASSVIKVHACHFPLFGMAESIWLVEVRDFPLTLTMDEKGNSLHNDLCKKSLENLKKIL